MKILFVNNKGVNTIGSAHLRMYNEWVNRYFDTSIDEYCVDVNTDEYSPFGIWDGVTLYGLSGIKEKLRPIVPDGYDIVIFVYEAKKGIENIANWTYPNDLNGASFCEIPFEQKYLLDSIKHETCHAIARMVNRRGYMFAETIDNGGHVDDNMAQLQYYTHAIQQTSLFRLMTTLKSLLWLLLKKTDMEKDFSKMLYNAAYSFLGKDASPTENELGCAESVNRIYKEVFGNEIGGGSSTYLMHEALKKRKDFKEIQSPEMGCIIISPTKVDNPTNHGHVGICGKDRETDGLRRVMSNNSVTYLWDDGFTIDSWNAYYKKKKGLDIFYYRKVA